MALRSFLPASILLFMVILTGCVKPPVITTESQTAANAEIEETRAQALSDSIVADLMKDDRPQIRSKMERAFKDYFDEDSFSVLTDQMFTLYGKPTEAWYLQNSLGRKTGTGGYDRPMRKFWYAIRTSKHEKGTVFLTIEIVPDGGSLASSGVMMVTFPQGAPKDFQ